MTASESGDGGGARVRVRGIYATALTALCREAGLSVVQASPPIRRRFDGEFPVAEHDVRVETTDDRQGLELSGTAVEAVRGLVADVGRDAFVWAEGVARDAVFDARVAETMGGGTVVDLGDAGEGYLPYGATDDRVSEGDGLRVQVHDPAPPWADHRPVVGTDLRVPGGVATLVRGVDALVAGTPDGTAEHELVGLTEMLPTDVPDGWGARWEYAADDADMDALGAALSAAADRAAALDAALDSPVEPPRRVAAPAETAWAWLGRECRFALDDVRDGVVTTLPGHHRIKAGDEAASVAVDFAEGLGASASSFPAATVLEQFGPRVGDEFGVEHGKPSGDRYTLGYGEVTDVDPAAGQVTLRRQMTGGGTYDALGVAREAGDTATTKFTEGRWWYPTTYRDEEGAVKGTYVNVSTPVELFPTGARYVDLHVDVIKRADGDVEVVDREELREAEAAGHVSEALADRAVDVAERIAAGIGD
ncbi:MAG: DUF402 domain-containing protein [Halobacteriaceae archaeon]